LDETRTQLANAKKELKDAEEGGMDIIISITIHCTVL
jgi:hypothetical protein